MDSVRVSCVKELIGPSPVLPARRRAIFAVTVVGAFMASLDLSVVNVAFPALERSWPHDTQASLAWVITAYAIVYGSLLVTAGRTADRLGRRRIFFGGMWVFTIGSGVCSLAPSLMWLVVGRVGQGVGAALLLPASLGLLLEAFPEELRPQAVALWAGAGALAVATGPSLGAAMISAGGWRLAFVINVPIGVAGWTFGRRVLADDRPDGRSASPDYLGVALVTTALAALVLAISEAPTWGWSDMPVLGCLAGSGAFGVLFVFRCARRPDPVLDLELFADRSFSVANAATALYAMGFFAMLLGNILFLTSVWRFSILDAGLAITPGPIVVALVSRWSGKLASRYGFRPVLVPGFAIFAIGLLWYVVRVGPYPDYAACWLPGTLIAGLGIGLTLPVLAAAAVASLGAGRFAAGSAVNQTARQVGGALGVAVLVAILAGSAADPMAHFRHVWEFAAAMAAVAGAVTVLLRPVHRRSAQETTPSPHPGQRSPRSSVPPSSRLASWMRSPQRERPDALS
jgi:EmrB/QacA subfamily drug resistance transporter